MIHLIKGWRQQWNSSSWEWVVSGQRVWPWANKVIGFKPSSSLLKGMVAVEGSTVTMPLSEELRVPPGRLYTLNLSGKHIHFLATGISPKNNIRTNNVLIVDVIILFYFFITPLAQRPCRNSATTRWQYLTRPWIVHENTVDRVCGWTRIVQSAKEFLNQTLPAFRKIMQL